MSWSWKCRLIDLLELICGYRVIFALLPAQIYNCSMRRHMLIFFLNIARVCDITGFTVFCLFWSMKITTECETCYFQFTCCFNLFYWQRTTWQVRHGNLTNISTVVVQVSTTK